MTYLHPHEQEELEVAFGPRLWDATPGVCCEYFQLGACAHTEGGEPSADELDVEPEPEAPRTSRNYEREQLDWF